MGPPPPKSSPTAGSQNQNAAYIAKHVFKYDDKGRKIENSVHRPNGEFIYKLVYTYDSQWRSNGYEQYKNDGKLSRTETIVFEGNNQFPSELIQSRSNGKPFLKITYSNYEANPKGDWIKRTEVLQDLDDPTQGKKVSVVTRTIDYY